MSSPGQHRAGLGWQTPPKSPAITLRDKAWQFPTIHSKASFPRSTSGWHFATSITTYTGVARNLPVISFEVGDAQWPVHPARLYLCYGGLRSQPITDSKQQNTYDDTCIMDGTCRRTGVGRVHCQHTGKPFLHTIIWTWSGLAGGCKLQSRLCSILHSLNLRESNLLPFIGVSSEHFFFFNNGFCPNTRKVHPET